MTVQLNLAIVFRMPIGNSKMRYTMTFRKRARFAIPSRVHRANPTMKNLGFGISAPSADQALFIRNAALLHRKLLNSFVDHVA